MAPQINPQSLAKSPTLQAAVVGELARYCAFALGNETPIVSPNPGYKAYNKRMQFCTVAVKNPEQYAEDLALLVSTIDITIEANANANFDYMFQKNPTGRSIMDADATTWQSWNNVGTTSGKSCLDVLAGVTAEDLL